MSEHLIRSAADWATVFRKRAIDLGLTHRDVDGLADLAPGYFSKIAAGMKIPGGEMIIRLCTALRIELRPTEKSEADLHLPHSSAVTRYPG